MEGCGKGINESGGHVPSLAVIASRTSDGMSSRLRFARMHGSIAEVWAWNSCKTRQLFDPASQYPMEADSLLYLRTMLEKTRKQTAYKNVSR